MELRSFCASKMVWFFHLEMFWSKQFAKKVTFQETITYPLFFGSRWVPMIFLFHRWDMLLLVPREGIQILSPTHFSQPGWLISNPEFGIWSYRSWISTKDMTDHHILCNKIFEIMSHNLGDFCLKKQKNKAEMARWGNSRNFCGVYWDLVCFCQCFRLDVHLGIPIPKIFS